MRHGDKKEICDDINAARWIAKFGLNSNSFEVKQATYVILVQQVKSNIKPYKIHEQ